MTTTNRLGDYVVFFQETLSKIRRHCQSKHARTETRQPKARRKSSLMDIMANADGQRVVYLSPNQIERQASMRVDRTARGSIGTLSVKMDRVQPQIRGTDGAILSSRGFLTAAFACVGLLATRLEDETADRFVELLDRSSRGQHVLIDPLLHEKRFQEKWKRPSGTSSKNSSQEVLLEQNPPTNRYYPPMFISRVRTSPACSSVMSQCKSVPALTLKSDTVSCGDAVLLHYARLSCLFGVSHRSCCFSRLLAAFDDRCGNLA